MTTASRRLTSTSVLMGLRSRSTNHWKRELTAGRLRPTTARTRNSRRLPTITDSRSIRAQKGTRFWSCALAQDQNLVPFCALIDRESVIVGSLREFLVRAVVGLNRPAVSSLFQWFVDLERSPINTLVDVRRRDAVVIRIKSQLVIRRIRIRLPFQLEIL